MRNYTDITILVDRSGSMETIRDAMEEGIKGYLKDLREKSQVEIRVTAIEFDDKYDKLYENYNIKDAPAINIAPRGSTALIGALGRAIDETGQRLANMAESDRPNQVIMVIITDGQENASHVMDWSKKYSQQKVLESVSHQRDAYNWTFTYLGANQDAFAVARSFGIAEANTMAYSSSPSSVRRMSSNLSAATLRAVNSTEAVKGAYGNAAMDYGAGEADVRDEDDKTKGESDADTQVDVTVRQTRRTMTTPRIKKA